MQDTSELTWRAMRQVYDADPKLFVTDVARSFNVLYSAAIERAKDEGWRGYEDHATSRAYWRVESPRLRDAVRAERRKRGRVVRPEATGLAAVIQLFPQEPTR